MTITDKKLGQWMIDLRRGLHQIPETAYQEFETTKKIAAVLAELGLEVRLFDDMTGVVGLLRGGAEGRTVALRADIDALPIDEQTESPYKSRHPGRMHACGHDAHTTIMLGVARSLKESGLDRELKGNVKFLFQPAEESGAGALKMIERGVLEDPFVDRVLAGHVVPNQPVGTVGVTPAQAFASADRLELVIQGRGGHGGMPHDGADPVLAGAQFVTALQSIVARNVPPLEAAVISVCRFSAGRTANVIPEEAALEGTIRALSQPVRELLWRRLKELSQGLEKSCDVTCRLTIEEGYPPCINDEEVSAFLSQVTAGLFGPDSVSQVAPVTGAEDFAFFAQKRPSAMIRLGCGKKAGQTSHPLHSPHFDLDEGVLAVGQKIFTEAVRRFLA
ncbi:MAG: amidohydrolase [Deltaproteobacteria bacterium]|nr:amidohydrolase [Deltaproteobacteria bacterium]